jgi:predicted kinase
LTSHHTPTVFFDAAMPAAKQRQKAISIAKRYSNDIIAVWIRASLDTAIQRNSNRTKDKRVPENAIKSVYSQLQAPTLAEGFTELIIINKQPINSKTA